jgi:hypothetical protein
MLQTPSLYTGSIHRGLGACNHHPTARCRHQASALALPTRLSAAVASTKLLHWLLPRNHRRNHVASTKPLHWLFPRGWTPCQLQTQSLCTGSFHGVEILRAFVSQSAVADTKPLHWLFPPRRVIRWLGLTEGCRHKASALALSTRPARRWAAGEGDVADTKPLHWLFPQLPSKTLKNKVFPRHLASGGNFG